MITVEKDVKSEVIHPTITVLSIHHIILLSNKKDKELKLPPKNGPESKDAGLNPVTMQTSIAQLLILCHHLVMLEAIYLERDLNQIHPSQQRRLHDFANGLKINQIASTDLVHNRYALCFVCGE